MDKRWTGDALRDLREAAGLTQADVARRVGVTRGRIHNLETSRHVTDRASRRVVEAIAELAAAGAGR